MKAKYDCYFFLFMYFIVQRICYQQVGDQILSTRKSENVPTVPSYKRRDLLAENRTRYYQWPGILRTAKGLNEN